MRKHIIGSFILSICVLIAYIFAFVFMQRTDDELLAVLVPVLVVASTGGLCFYLAEKRRKSGFIGFLTGLLFGPFAVLYYSIVER